MTAVPGAQSAPGIRIARIGGVPVYIGKSWALLGIVIVILVGPNLAQSRPDLGVLAYAVAAAYALLLLVAVFVHEGAHAVAARRFGYPVHRVVADLWGGHTALDATRATPGPSAVVAIAGPISNLVLAAVGAGLATLLPSGVPGGLANAFAFLNAALGLFNLLPGLPLDGGQLVEASVWRATGSRARGKIVAGFSGLVVAVGVLLWFVGRPLLSGQTPSVVSLAWSLLIVFFLWNGARGAIGHGRAVASIEGVRVRDALVPVVFVDGQTPLSAIPAGSMPVVLDRAGLPTALIDSAAAASVPAHAMSSTSAAAVSRPQPLGWLVDADPEADIASVIATLAGLGTGVLAIRHEGRIVGVITLAAIDRAIASRGR